MYHENSQGKDIKTNIREATHNLGEGVASSPPLGEGMMKKVNLNIRIDKDIRDEFHRMAEHNTQNPSALMRKWIKEYIAENKEDFHE